MNKEQAEEKGYIFTGIYVRQKDEKLKDLLEKIRNDGYKAIIVTELDSPYSKRIKGTGYAIYADRRYFIDKEILELGKKINSVENLMKYEYQEYQKKIKLIVDNRDSWIKRLSILKES